MNENVVRLGDISTLINGDRGKNYPSQKDIVEDGEVPFVNAGHLVDNLINSENMNYITRDKFNKLSSGKFIKGDILYCLRGSLGKKAIVTDSTEGAIASSLVIIRPNEKNVLSEYLSLALDSSIVYKQLHQSNNGSSQPNLSAKSVREYKIALHSLEQQTLIVNKIDKIKNILNLKKEQLSLLDELIKSRFVEMFGVPESNEKNWELKTFKDICTVRQGLQIPIRNRLVEKKGNCFTYITVAYINGKKSEEFIENPKSTVICTKEDLLMTRTGNTGMVITGVEGVFHNNFFLIDFDRRKYDKTFLYYYLNLEYIQSDIMRRADTSTIPDLNHGEFYKIVVYEAPIELQSEFAEFVKHIDKLKFEVKKSLDETQLLFDSLMQNYFE